MWCFTTFSSWMSSSFWTTHWITNGLTSKFYLIVSALSYPFQHVLWYDIWSLSCLNFIIFWLKGKCLAYNSTSFPYLLIIFPSFFHNTLNTTWTTPSLNCKYPLMRVHTSHQPYGYPFLMLFSWQWTHMNPWCNFLTPLLPLCEMLVSMWDENNDMHFLQSHSTPFIDELTLCSLNITFTP
jgi:hypothetical protein